MCGCEEKTKTMLNELIGCYDYENWNDLESIERVRNGPSVGGSFAARWARMVLKRCSSERGEREKRFYGDGKDVRRRTAF